VAVFFRKRASGTIPTPAAGKSAIFVDTSGIAQIKDESGSVSKLGAGNLGQAQVNITDYGADRTGAVAINTALTNAIADLPSGGVVYFPAGTYLLSSTFQISTAHITLRGSAKYATTILANFTTGDILQFNQWFQRIEQMTIQGTGSGQVSTRTAGYNIGASGSSAYGIVRDCSVTYAWDGINIGNTLGEVHDCEIRYFAHSGIVVTHNSDHRISNVTMDNNAGALPTGSGIDVQATASLLLSGLNIIHANYALNVSPGVGVTIPSIKAVNCFFDTSAYGLRIAGAGSFFRSTFTNCWFSSHSVAGIYIAPSTGGNMADGITFINCDIYNNLGGTTNGIHFATANYGKIDFIGCRIAGWTNGVNIAFGSTTAFPRLVECQVGSVSAFGVNTNGVVVAAITVAGLVITDCDVTGNTTPFTLGVVTAAIWSQYRITDNVGINPRGAVTTPAFPATTVVVTNTTGFRVLVGIKGGTSTAVAVNGVAAVLAATPASIYLEPGGTVAITFTVAPTWVWVGE
jgi:hypothetical protein